MAKEDQKMELDWSEQSPHIRSLFRPWQPGDGYDEATIQAAEARLGVRLPATLRTFYLVWGRREDLTRAWYYLLNPEDLLIRANTLIFWVENQAVVYWGIPREAMSEPDPPVVITYSGESGWEVESELHWTPSHAQLSSLLDDLTYLNAFGGAAHTGVSAAMPQQAQQIAWLEEAWGKAKVTPACFGMPPETKEYPTLYIREGQALHWVVRYGAVAGEAKALDEIAQALQITWEKQW
jgi:hypothetical protein